MYALYFSEYISNTLLLKEITQRLCSTFPNKLILYINKLYCNSLSCEKYHTIPNSNLYNHYLNDYGQLKLGDNKHTTFELALENIASVSCGINHITVTTKDGETYTRGNNGYNQYRIVERSS